MTSEEPTLTGYRGAVTSVAFSPDGRTPASGSADDAVVPRDTADQWARYVPSLGYEDPCSAP